MAIPTYQAIGAVASGFGAISPAYPASVAANDIAILVVQSSNQAIATPAGGWAEVTNSPQGTGTAGVANAVRIGVFWRRCTGVEGGTTVSVADTGDHTVARILTYRGCIASGNPWDVTAGGVKAAASTTSTNPSVTTTVVDCLIVVISGHARDSNSTTTYSAWTNANLSALTERADNGISTGTGGGFGIADGGKATIGATGTTTATLAASTTNAYLTIALKPPSGTNFFLMF